MPTIISPTITDAGLAAAINADANGLQLAITHVALGTGQYTPSIAQTALTARKEKVTISGGFVTGVGGFKVNVLFNGWSGTPNPYNATEVGFYAGDPDAGGILFAVYSSPTSVIVQRNALDYIASFGLQLSRVPTGSVTVEVDPSGAHALALIAYHESLPDAHTAYVKKAGDTMSGHLLTVTPTFGDVSKKAANTEFLDAALTAAFAAFAASLGAGVTLATTAPVALAAAAAVGTGTKAARNDHVHPFPTAANVGAVALSGDSTVDGSVKFKNVGLKSTALGNISGAVTINLALGGHFTATAVGNCTFTFTNALTTGYYGGFDLDLVNGGAYALTFPSSVKWAGGTMPVLTASGTDCLSFPTANAGATYRGTLWAKDSK